MNNIFHRILLVLTFFSFSLTASAVDGQAPEFELNGVNTTVKLSDYRGKVVYLDFWASWCEPCKRSFPWMNQLQAQYGRDGFAVVAINIDESADEAARFLQQIPASFDIAYDPSGKTAEAYGLRAMPTSFLIGPDGKLLHSSLGYRAAEKRILENKIRDLVAGRHLASN